MNTNEKTTTSPVENTARHQSEFAADPDMRELVEEYVADLPGHVSRLNELLARAEMTELERLAHQLKGAGGGYGFPTITTLAAAANGAIRRQEPLEKIQQDIHLLIDYIRNVAGYDPTREASNVADCPGH